MDSSKANLVLEKFDNKLGFGQTPQPPTPVGPKDKVFLFFVLEGSPNEPLDIGENREPVKLVDQQV